jgi:hypothetical protein
VAVGALIVAVAAVDVRIFGEPWREWLRPQPILTFTSVITGFLVLRWQLAVQHRNAMRANAEKDRNQLHLEIYRDIALQSEKASRALRDFGALGMETSMAASLADLPAPPAFPEPHRVRELWQAATAEVIALNASLEKWEIAMGPGAANFKRALGDGLTGLSKAVDRVQPALAFATARRAPADLDRAKAAGDGLHEATLTIDAYIWDLRIALQNELLGGLFIYRVPMRQPGDQQYKAVTLAGSWTPLTPPAHA